MASTSPPGAFSTDLSTDLVDILPGVLALQWQGLGKARGDGRIATGDLVLLVDLVGESEEAVRHAVVVGTKPAHEAMARALGATYRGV